MPGNFKIDDLYQDLGRVIFGVDLAGCGLGLTELLFRIFPPREDAMVLEPGCGSGKFSLSYALWGCEVFLIDIDPVRIQYARRLRGALNSLVGYPLPVSIKMGNIHRINHASDHFDLVFNEGVCQHWPDEKRRQGSIDEMVRVCKDTVIVTGNNGLLPEEQERDKTFKFGYRGMPPTRKCFTPEELEMRLKKAGLKDIRLEPMAPLKLEDSPLIIGWGRKH